MVTNTRLKLDIPGLHTAPGEPQTDTVQAVNQLTGKITQVHNKKAAQDQITKLKSLSTYSVAGVVLLCQLTYVMVVDQLPAVYHSFAKSPRRMECQAIKERFQAVANTLLLMECVQIATASLAKKISNCDYKNIDMVDLEGSMQPFITAYRNLQARMPLAQVLYVYDDLHKGTGATILEPMITWLVVACTKDKVGQSILATGPPAYPHPPILALLDMTIDARLKVDLPGLHTAPGPQTGTNLAINQLTSKITQVGNKKVAQDQATRLKSPSIYYGVGVVLLCQLTYIMVADC